MIKTCLILLACFVLVGCAREEVNGCTGDYQTCYLKATVKELSDITCYQPVLDFSGDSVRINELTKDGGLYYNVTGLTPDYAVVGKKLFVVVELLKPGEGYFCNTLGIMLPRLKITDIKER